MTLNEIEQRLSALKSEQDKLTAELERLKAEKSEVKPWRAASGDAYYGISSDGTTYWGCEDDSSLTNTRFDNGNYYRTKELAEQDAKELALRGRIRQLRDALCEGYQFIPDGDNFHVYFDTSEKYFFIGCCEYHKYIGEIYFDTREHAQQACDILNAEMEARNDKS